MTYSAADINQLGQCPIYHGMRPVQFVGRAPVFLCIGMALYEILPGRRDSLVIEPYRYLRGRVSVYGKQKYLSDYFRRFRVDGKLVSNRRMQYIALTCSCL